MISDANAKIFLKLPDRWLSDTANWEGDIPAGYQYPNVGLCIQFDLHVGNKNLRVKSPPARAQQQLVCPQTLFND